MYVLGINSLYHESAACLLADGVLVAAAEEERFTRVKHAKKPHADNPDELPVQAIQYCLETAGIDIRQVDWVGYSSDPRWLEQPPSALAEWMVVFRSHLQRLPEKLAALGFPGEFTWVGHHLAHAASAFYASPFQEAAVLTVDGVGDSSTAASYQGSGNRLEFLQDIPITDSLGFLWELVSMFLGFDIYDAAKVMGLAAFGDPARFRDHFRLLVRLLPDGRFATHSDLLRFWRLDYFTPSGYFSGLERLFGIKRRRPGQRLTSAHQDIAAALQRRTDEVVGHMAEHLHRRTGERNLCLAGGVALNCLTNQRVFEQGPFAGLFVQPAAHDAGTAIGAALYIWHQLLGNPRRDWMRHAYWGPCYSSAQIEHALRGHGLAYRRCESVEQEVARLLEQGHVVSYFQGRMEVGPRALGNRSLLADPRDPHMRDILNQKVKHREYFRPFAPSILDEEAKRWFHIGKETPASDFMLMAYPAREELKDRIPAVVHADGTSRIQTVKRDTNPRYHALIAEFYKLTGVPLVLNTSFNDSEPIVCAPEDAIETFLTTDIDYLAMGDFLVSKAANGAARESGRELARGLDRVLPVPHRLFETALQSKQLYQVDDFYVMTDGFAHRQTDQVLALFPEHRFFLDEIVRERIKGAKVLEFGAGSAVLSIAAVRAGAEHVVALESNPRARTFAGFNILLNGCEDRIEILEGSASLFQPVAGRRFDCFISNPPFLPTPPESDLPLHSSAEPYGLDFVDKIFRQLDDYLASGGYAQIVTLAPGDARQPFLLVDLAMRHLSGKTLIRVNPEKSTFDDLVGWLRLTGAATRAQAEEMRLMAKRDGVSHLYLCMVHYDKGGERMLHLEPPKAVYHDWHLPLGRVVTLKTRSAGNGARQGQRP